MASSNTIAVVGATGYIGSATVNTLSAAGVAAKAVVRDPAGDKAAGLKDLAHIELVAGSMADTAGLATALTGTTTAYIVTPGVENRADLVANAVSAAKTAGVAHIVVVSVSTTGTDTIFGRQFTAIEATVKDSGLAYTLLRLPLFTDNNYANVASIKGEGKIYNPADPTKAFTTATVGDIAQASATILQAPAAHASKTYDFAGPAYTHNDLAAAFTKTLEKPVEFVQVPYEAAKEAFMGMGFPEWQTDGILELYKFVDADTYRYPSADLEAILGRAPTGIEAWVEANKAGFS